MPPKRAKRKRRDVVVTTGRSADCNAGPAKFSKVDTGLHAATNTAKIPAELTHAILLWWEVPELLNHFLSFCNEETLMKSLLLVSHRFHDSVILHCSATTNSLANQLKVIDKHLWEPRVTATIKRMTAWLPSSTHHPQQLRPPDQVLLAASSSQAAEISERGERCSARVQQLLGHSALY